MSSEGEGRGWPVEGGQGVSQYFKCKKSFDFFNRHHHCRWCGRIFCGDCSSHVISGLALGNDSPDPVRVCDGCFKAKNPEQPAEAVPAVVASTAPPAPPIDQEPEPQPDGGLFDPLLPERIAVPSARIRSSAMGSGEPAAQARW